MTVMGTEILCPGCKIDTETETVLYVTTAMVLITETVFPGTALMVMITKTVWSWYNSVGHDNQE